MSAAPEAPIRVRDLTKVFRVHEREEGLAATARSLFRRHFKEVAAVQDVSFDIGVSEMVGFLGPNGAGKTTTLKMLSGLLHPTSGEARVEGHIPWKREPDLLRNITLVMGNRSQLIWDIPAADSMRVLQEIFQIPEERYRRTLRELSELLELEPLLHKPIRNLSLGERMKVEFAAALIHEPRVLFLDEPTIGLDVTMQARIRRFVAEYNRRTGATVLLTSHYMDDVVALCKRVVVIHRGRLLYDGALTGLAERMAPYKLIRVTLRDSAMATPLGAYGEEVEREENRVTLRVPRDDAPDRTARLIQDLRGQVLDLTLEDPAIEEIIDRVFSSAEISPESRTTPSAAPEVPTAEAQTPHSAAAEVPRGEAQTPHSAAAEVPRGEAQTPHSAAAEVPLAEAQTPHSAAAEVPPAEPQTPHSAAAEVPPAEAQTPHSAAAEVPPAEPQTPHSAAAEMPPEAHSSPSATP